MIAMIGTSDRLCWLAETCKMHLLLLQTVQHFTSPLGQLQLRNKLPQARKLLCHNLERHCRSNTCQPHQLALPSEPSATLGSPVSARQPCLCTHCTVTQIGAP